MQSISDYIEDDEKILFQRTLINPAHKKNIKSLMIMGYTSLILLTIFITGFMIFISFIVFSILLGFIVSIFVLTTLALYLPYHRYANILKVTFKQIKKYKELYVLTNRTWIQKSLDILSVNESTFPLQITLQKDLIKIDFSQIKSFFVQRRDSYKNYFIGFDIELPSGQGFFIPYQIFPEFIEILKEVIPIQREVHDKHGLIYFHRE